MCFQAGAVEASSGLMEFLINFHVSFLSREFFFPKNMVSTRRIFPEKGPLKSDGRQTSHFSHESLGSYFTYSPLQMSILINYRIVS